jgi:lysophospholipid acyltransferase (LPLAT)-like uncharacterized protein
VTTRSKRKFTFGQHIVLAVVPRIVWAFLWPIGLTWRFESIAVEGVTPVVYGQKAGAEIYCFWHQCVLSCTIFYRVTRAVILISQSFDGELITRILRLFGFDAVRGSSSRGGMEGLQALRRVIESGKTAIFTADGPRGPIYQTKMGPIKLASITGAPIGAFYMHPERAWQLNSWDRFLIPKPFTRIVVSWGQWTHVPMGTPSEEFEAKRQELNAALERARLNAIAHFQKDSKGKPGK